jgi:hypothetical protein
MLEFCMRELRWPSVAKRAEAVIHSDDPRLRRLGTAVFAVYADEWEDADMYATYSGERNARE